MKLLKYLPACTLIATLILAGLHTSTATAQSVTLRMHQFLPQQANVPKLILQKWIDDVEKASNGDIKVQMYSSMALGGKPPELYDQAVDGVADIIWTVSGYTPGRFSETEVFELPFMMSNAEATSRAYWTYAQDKLIHDEMADTHVLGLWVHGPGLIHSKNPVQSPDDLKGMKLRAPTRTTNILFSTMGAEVIGMPVPAVPENLSKGVIDAAVIPWEVTAALKVPELVGNHTEFPGSPLYTTTFIMAMNKDRYESLTDEQKAIINAQSGLEFSAFAGRTMAAADGPSRKMAADAGNNIIELGAADIQAWKTAAEVATAQWISEINDQGRDGQALINEAKKLIDQFSN